MMRKKVAKQRPRQKGVERVKSWIYAVINPLIEALKVERTFLKEKNWTWHYHTKRLEFILPLEQYVDSAYLPVFEDFFKANPSMERRRKKREELRAALSENCQIAFGALIDSQAFQEKVKTFLALYLKEVPAREYLRGTVPEEDFHKLVAQYVLNQIQELPSHYTTSRFWSRFRDKFLPFRTGTVFERLDMSGKLFENDDDRFLTALSNCRSSLVEEYGIPAAPAPMQRQGRRSRSNTPHRALMLLIPRHPIVDTGPLFDYLLWQFSCSPHFRKAGRSLAFRYLQNEPYK